MKLSIIIVNYNVKYFLEQCLNSILASKTDFDYEIIIVDNNSTDQSIPYLQARFSNSCINYILNNDNPGFAKANNQAVAQTKGEYILFLNPDTVLGENTLQNVIHFYDQDKLTTGAIGVKMINGYGKFLPESKRGVPSPWVSFCRISGLQSIFPKSKIFGKYNQLYLDKNLIHQVPILAGAFMMVSREIINKIGSFDESFFMYGEDIDLSYRIEKAGYKNYYLPETILHYKGESTDKNDYKYIKAFHDAMQIFYKKYYLNKNKIFSRIIIKAISSKLLLSKRKAQVQKDEIAKQTLTFDTSLVSYENIISEMEKNSKNNTQFLIYSPYTNITIGTKTIILNADHVSRK